ncbi:MAG: DEAD/DEAH box helicase [Muribaculaceae bacterium]|nr:DEAD/DEAH box helicase [Muribaculaceae bacterium]
MTNKEILSSITSRLGISELNPMQKVISPSDRRKFILLSPTGSGKTLAFSIAVLKAIKAPCGRVQALILAPSRELVQQIAGVIRPIATGYKTTALYGGHAMMDEVNSLSVVPDIVVATPGRLLDHIERRQIDLRNVGILVLDEYDKSLELGFQDEMQKIVRRISAPSTIVFTSATPIDKMPDFISMAGAKVYDFVGAADNRKRLEISKVASPSKDKLDVLMCLLHSIDNGKVIIFVNHRESVERVYERVAREGFPVGFYHGGLDQQKREMAVDMLNNGTTPVLVSTDLGARGLDIDSVSAVIHYHMPLSEESWTHRNGRTARVDAEGKAYVIVSDGEKCPEYVEWDADYNPSGHSDDPIESHTATLYINAGKKEKISRGDVAGYVIRALGIAPEEVDKIVVKDHYAIVGVPRNAMKSIIAINPVPKIKNIRVRLSFVGV